MSISISLQAGGISSRMGTDKGLLPFLGVPLVERIFLRLLPITNNIFVTSNNLQAYAFLNVPVYSDIYPGKGTLGGVITAMTYANTDIVIIVACDMPFVNPRLLQAQLERMVSTGCDVVIPKTPQGLEPLHSVYRVEKCLPAAEKALRRGERRVISWFPEVDVSMMESKDIHNYDPGYHSFLNVNTPEDFRAAEGLALQIDETSLSDLMDADE